MAIQIKSVERGQPGIAGGGVKKYYASPVHDREITLEGLTKAIEKTSTVNGADIRAVLYAMVEEAVNGLADGRIIRRGGIERFDARSAGEHLKRTINLLRDKAPDTYNFRIIVETEN